MRAATLTGCIAAVAIVLAAASTGAAKTGPGITSDPDTCGRRQLVARASLRIWLRYARTRASAALPQGAVGLFAA